MYFQGESTKAPGRCDSPRTPNAEYVLNRLKHTALLHALRATRINACQTVGKYIFNTRRALRPFLHYSAQG